MRDESRITTLRRSLGEWAERPANERFLCAEPERILLDCATQPRLRPQAPVAAWMLGTWRLGHGFARVMQGEVRGFDEARTGQALRRSSVMMRQRAGLPCSLTQAVLSGLYALALDDPDAEPLFDVVLAETSSRRFDARDHLALFARELLVLRSGRRSNIPNLLGPYQEVILHWTGEDRLLALRLAEALDGHLDQARRRGSPFDDPPTWLYPVEALALRSVRRWCELSTPKIDHALMFTNLVTMAPQGPWPEDPIVKRLARM